MLNPQAQQPEEQQWNAGELAEDERGAIEPLEPESRRARGPVYRRVYSTGNDDLDRQVSDLIETLKGAIPDNGQPIGTTDLELVREMYRCA